MPRPAQAAPLLRVPIPTLFGPFLAHFSECGLARLDFPDQRNDAPRTGKLSVKQKRWRQLTHAAMARIIAGKKPRTTPPMDLPAATEFQRAVWRALQQIPSGTTCSYAQIAAAIGRPRATRAVGTACGANPIPLLVPCHRVVGASGLGGFSGGLAWKKRLLTAEAVALNTRSTRR